MSYKRISPQPVVEGGTGAQAYTAYAPVCGGTTTTGALQAADSGISNSGYVLTSTGASSLPTWQAGGGGGAGTITGNDGTPEAQVGGNWDILTAGANIGFIGSSGTETISFAGDVSGNLLLGSGVFPSTYTGIQNTAFGLNALPNLTSGNQNTAGGQGALSSIVGGNNNTALGTAAASNFVSDSNNTGIGWCALQAFNAGSNNTALGEGAGAYHGNFLSGSNNTFLGYNTAASYTSTEANNILINSLGVIGESNILRICDTANTSTGTGLSAAYIGGISGVTVTGAAVLVSASDQLGIAVSSAKYKDNIQDMGDASEAIYNLRPTTFTYKGSTETHYGLIAEEVDQVMPNLVVYDKSGDPQTVMYHELPALLLNEIQKLRKELTKLKESMNGK